MSQHYCQRHYLPREGNSARLLGGAQIFPSDLDWHRRRLAPHRLHAEPYHRAVWQLRFLTVDPMTFEPLIDTCPVCRKGLRWARSVKPHLCDHCVDNRGRSNIDLREFASMLISLPDPDAYRFVFELVDPANGPAIGRPEWPGVKPGVLFELAILLARWANRSEGSTSMARWKGIQPEMLAKAGRIVLSGPAALRKVDEDTETTLHKRFRNSVITNRWLNLPIRQLVEQTIEPWNEIDPLGDLAAGNNLSPTRTLLRSPPPVANSPRTDEFMARFAHTSANARSDKAVARYMGVTHTDVEILIAEGFLERPSKLAVAALRRTSLVTGDSFSSLLKMLKDLERAPNDQQVFACNQVVEIAQFPYSAGALITVILKARLPIYRVKLPTGIRWTSMFGVVDIDPLPRFCQKLQLRPTRQG